MNVPSALTIPFRIKSIAAIDNDIDEELEFHIQCRVEELVAKGISAEDAEKRARELFGSTSRIRKQCQRINYGTPSWLVGLIFLGLLGAAIAIGWLSLQLMSLKTKNDRLVEQLMAVAAPTFSPVLSIVETRTREKLDLTGTVTDPDGNPVADATVLLIFKSWPGGQYRQDTLDTKTDAEGAYQFENLYSTDMQTAFLVSVVIDGYTLESKYWVNEKREVIKPVEIGLRKAIPKTLILLQKNGDPLANTKVFPQARNTKSNGSGGDMIYQHSAEEVMLSTNEDGKVKMNYFVSKDKAVIGVMIDGNIVDVEFKVDDEAEQTVGGKPAGGKPGKPAGAKTGKADLTGTVMGEDGSVVAGAAVLLIHKSWPNDRYRQDNYKTKTDVNGKFIFPKRYRLNEQNGFLVSIVADGWAMNSEYLLDEDGNELDPFSFRLEKATSKTFVFQDENGKALKRVAVFPSSRKTDDDEEFMIYAMSGKDVDQKTDGDGKVQLNCFVAGDTATFGFVRGGSMEVEIDDDTEQVVTVKKK